MSASSLSPERSQNLQPGAGDPATFELPFGAQLLPNGAGVRFRLWAPDAEEVALILNDNAPLPLDIQADGWVDITLPNASAGDRYAYLINGELQVPDPASRYQPGTVHEQSQVIDPASFEWKDNTWTGRPWEEAVIYELHVGTFTPEGTYRAIIDKLDYLSGLGITAIELMPLAQFPGDRNWGYDGVLPFAPENRYGTPDDLKALIQAAHQKNIMVFLDVVYNHFGPEGNYLPVFAKRFFTDRHKTPWGEAIHFEDTRPVRDFFIGNAMYWLHEFHFDGLRLDAVHAIKDESPVHFLNELAEQVRASFGTSRHIHLILENDDNQARFLSGNDRALYNAQWNDDMHHAAHVALTGEAEGYYSDYAAASSSKSAIGHLARCLTAGYAYQADPSPFRDGEIRGEKSDQLPLTAFINFLQNHDQIGNRAFGDRLSTLSDPTAMKAALTALLLSPTIPMLFMGEEWQSKTPFQFFCDFGPDLGPLVTEGRRKEFARFPEFSKPENQAKIPDPCLPGTFEASKLNWDDLSAKSYQDTLEFTRHLLRTRQTVIVPMLKTAAETPVAGKPTVLYETDCTVIIAWPFSESNALVLALNLGEKEASVTGQLPPSLQGLGTDALVFESVTKGVDALRQRKLLPFSAVYVKVPSWKQ